MAVSPAYSDGWATVYATDALTGLRELPAASVHMCITSPPYWGLRSYLPAEHEAKGRELGAEETPEKYVENLVAVMREVWRVLRDDGTAWLNLGDSYFGGGQDGGQFGSKKQKVRWSRKANRETVKRGQPDPRHGLKFKDLVMIPARAALALQADGWYLRSEIIWHKPNPMPESVTDRPTSATEKVYLLTKKPRYFYDAEAVKEAAIEGTDLGLLRSRGQGDDSRVASHAPSIRVRQAAGIDSRTAGNGKRNLRNVWTVATKPYKGSHYAVFPPALIEPCIKAGTSEKGVCGECGAPWRRVVERISTGKSKAAGKSTAKRNQGLVTAFSGHDDGSEAPVFQTTGWQPTCSHQSDTLPATVLDPFMGSGTTAVTARKLGRRSVGFDLDQRNIALIEERMGHQGVLL